jgi:hypothetical protein
VFTLASLTTFARLIATAAPIDALPLLEAVPSAFAFAVVCDVEESESDPPAVSARDSPGVALVVVFAMFTATAAATLTPPPEVDADGVFVAPELEPPFPDAWLSAAVRSPVT